MASPRSAIKRPNRLRNDPKEAGITIREAVNVSDVFGDASVEPPLVLGDQIVAAEKIIGEDFKIRTPAGGSDGDESHKSYAHRRCEDEPAWPTRAKGSKER